MQSENNDAARYVVQQGTTFDSGQEQDAVCEVADVQLKPSVFEREGMARARLQVGTEVGWVARGVRHEGSFGCGDERCSYKRWGEDVGCRGDGSLQFRRFPTSSSYSSISDCLNSSTRMPSLVVSSNQTNPASS